MAETGAAELACVAMTEGCMNGAVGMAVGVVTGGSAGNLTGGGCG